MRSPLLRWLVRLVPVAVLGALVTAVALIGSGSALVPGSGVDASDLGFMVPFVVAASVGAIVVLRLPRHPVGWLLLWYGTSGAIANLGAGVTFRLALAGNVATAGWVESLAAAVVSSAFLTVPAILLVFPTGRFLSRRWARLTWVVVVAAVLAFFVSLVNNGFLGDTTMATVEGPLRGSLGATADALGGPSAALVMGSFALAVVSLILRFRRAEGEERHQIKWVAMAAALFVAVILLTSIPGPDSQSTLVQDVMAGLSLALIPSAMGVSILKYRLYDVDVVISRSLAYGALAAFIGAVYVGVVVGIGSLVDAAGGAGFGLSVAATALVAMAFQPVRSRVERWANRLVYGVRATPYEVLARFSRRATEVADAELLERIPRLVSEGTGAVWASLWVRSHEGFRTVASWPDGESDRRLEGSETFTDPHADLSVPVFHDGDMLGGVSLLKERGEGVSPAERELLANLAGGLGITLRNAELTSRLRRQVRDLERSRDRLVTAADEARRSLEHDLDSGPQQQLVAVKVKLGPMRKLAERRGAERTAQILADIEAQAGEALKAVRDFAGGIYPPLLEAEGLVVALGHQAHKTALPVTVHSDGCGRYSREIEAAVYFTVLEALQNVAKYADAADVSVSLSDHDGVLTFSVVDDGRGFDAHSTAGGAGITGMADRVDTVGGSCRITSSPGLGTTVSGSIPIPVTAS